MKMLTKEQKQAYQAGIDWAYDAIGSGGNGARLRQHIMDGCADMFPDDSLLADYAWVGAKTILSKVE